MYSHIQKRLKKCDRPERFCYCRRYSAIDQCTASRTSQGWCDDTMTKLLRALALVEVLNVVSIMCVDIGVVKGSVQSNHSVNTTLVYFNSTPTAWLSAFIHGSWLSDLFYVCLFILLPPKKTTCQAEVLHSSALLGGVLLFTDIWMSLEYFLPCL